MYMVYVYSIWYMYTVYYMVYVDLHFMLHLLLVDYDQCCPNDTLNKSVRLHIPFLERLNCCLDFKMFAFPMLGCLQNMRQSSVKVGFLIK